MFVFFGILIILESIPDYSRLTNETIPARLALAGIKHHPTRLNERGDVVRESSKRAASKPVKPEKPFDGFPLTVNGKGQWSKKLRGKVFYFGTWDDWEEALEES
jgi:hypothetical protein